MASLVQLSPFPTLWLAQLLPSWDSAPGLSSLQSQGGGKELRLFAFHYNFQSPSAAHMIFSFNCLIPRTLFTQELIKFYHVSPVPLDFDPSFSSPRNTVLTDTLGGETLCRPLSLGNVSLGPTFCLHCLLGRSNHSWKDGEKHGERSEKMYDLFVLSPETGITNFSVLLSLPQLLAGFRYPLQLPCEHLQVPRGFPDAVSFFPLLQKSANHRCNVLHSVQMPHLW